MKLQAHITIIVASIFLLLLGLVLERWQVSISIEPLQPEVTPLPEEPTLTIPTASTSSSPMPMPTLTTPAESRNSPSGTGALRVSNRTEHPIRIALLTKQLAATSQQSGYDKPAHWDFVPGEGSSTGLKLALPDRQLKLNKGDILVAFAQDGSRRYWGPYVVGETVLPLWNRQASEWDLILPP